MDVRPLSDADWHRLAPFLPGRGGTRGRSGDDNRRFLDAVKWTVETGGPWRDLPIRFGPWNTAWRRYHRWRRAGVWLQLWDRVQDPAFEWLCCAAASAEPRQHAAADREGARHAPSVLSAPASEGGPAAS